MLAAAPISRVTRIVFVALIALLALIVLVAAPRAAHAESLLFDPPAAAECPDCATPTGGAQVINYLEQLAPQDDVSLIPTDGASPPEGGWQASASTMVADEGAMSSATGAAAEAADAVASTSVLAEEVAGGIELCTTGVACPIALAAGAFGAGYVIGTGAKALYLKFYGGDAPNNDPLISGSTWYRWTGSSDYQAAGANGPIVHPGEYYLYWFEENPFGYNQFNYAWQGAVGPGQCRFGLPTPHFVVSRLGTSTLRCDVPSPVVTYVRTPDMFFSHRRPPAPASSTNTSGATTVPAPPTPTRGDFADAARSVLNRPSSAKFQLWLEHELSPRCHADPTKPTINVPNPLPGESESSFEGCLATLGLAPTSVELSDAVLDANFGEPVWSNPGDGASVSPGTTIKVYVNPPASRSKTKPDERCRPDDSTPAGDPGPNPPGYAGANPDFQPRPAPALAGYPGYDVLNASPRTIRLWWGTQTWGYRHIMMRRGYGLGDEADTAEALLDPSPVPNDPFDDSSWRFYSFYDVSDAITGMPVHCARTVVVNFYHRDIEPDPRDIITSFYGSYEP